MAGGVLICPTNAGAVLGVDVLTGSLLWAHVYQDAGTTSPAHSPWQNGPPRIVEGRVIVAPPDAGVIDCLDLHDGTPCRACRERRMMSRWPGWPMARC